MSEAALDPRLAALRSAGVIMAATLACFFSAWLVEDLAGLHSGVVVLAVALGLGVGRTRRHLGAGATLVGAVVLALAAVVAAVVGLLWSAHPIIGGVLFATSVAGTIFVRRFGAGFAHAGTLATSPFVAVLIAPAPSGSWIGTVAWTTTMAVIAYGWATLARLLTGRGGDLTTRSGPTSRAPTPSGLEPGRSRAFPGPASTRMAVQMGIRLGVASWSVTGCSPTTGPGWCSPPSSSPAGTGVEER